MHNYNFNELLFATTYVIGLRDDIRDTMEPHVLTTM